MTTAVVDSGSQTATISTEHTLSTINTAGTYICTVDLSNFAAGDELELRVYSKVRSTDAEILRFIGFYGPTVPAIKFAESLGVVSPHHLKFTLKQVAGTGRAFPWAIYSV